MAPAAGLLSCEGKGTEAVSEQTQEETKPEEVAKTDNMEVAGLYVNDSYTSNKSDQLKLVYLFYTVRATDKNLQAYSKSTDMKIGENTYTSEHHPGARSYASSFYYSDFIEDVYIGNEFKVLETFEVPMGDLEAGKEITLHNSRTPGIDDLRLSTDSIKHLDSAEAIAQDADPEGYASELQKHEAADAETTAKVQDAVNGYYWKYAPALGTTITMYKTEFFAPNSFETTVSGITAGGTYEVENGYVKLINDGNGYVVEVPYSWNDDGSINLDLATAYGVHEG